MELLKKINKNLNYSNRVKHLDDIKPFSFLYEKAFSEASSADEILKSLSKSGDTGYIVLKGDKISNLRYYHYPTGRVLKVSPSTSMQVIKVVTTNYSIIRLNLVHPSPKSSFTFNFEVMLTPSGALAPCDGGSFLFIK